MKGNQNSYRPSYQEAVIIGTAGLTAAMCVDALQRHEVRPEKGTVLVTGATGGVGSVAVAILANLGFEVAAVTGKATSHDYLKRLGAGKILSREDVNDTSDRPLLSAGSPAVSIPSAATSSAPCSARSRVAACGLAASNELPITVYPFILCAITLTGIDAAWCSSDARTTAWRRLSSEWKLPQLEAMARMARLENIGTFVNDILAGRIRGRTVVEISSAT